MIHVLTFIVKIIAIAIMCCTIGLGCIILSLLLWDARFMELGEEAQNQIWKKQINKNNL